MTTSSGWSSETCSDRLHELSLLSKEFDCLGLPTININVDVLDQLITSVSRLLGLHRRALQKQKDCNLETNRLLNEIKDKNGNVSYLKDSIEALEDTISKQKSKICKLQSDNETLKINVEDKHKELQSAKLHLTNKESELQHKINKLQGELDKNKDENILPKYISHDERLFRILQRYRAREEIYKETIQELQTNNNLMLKEVISLREEILPLINEHMVTS